MEKLYETLKQKIQQVDFETLWPGFHPCDFALYHQDEALLAGGKINTGGKFFGNTAIEREGKGLAIWDVGEPPYDRWDPDTLAADIIHEMFHAFQAEQKESRFPNELAGLTIPAVAEHFQLKWQENRLLAQAIRAAGWEEAREKLSLFCRLRRKRASLQGESISYELQAETGEGMAEYVGSMALRILSPEKYRLRLENYLNLLETLSPLLLKPRKISYYTGTMLLLAAKKADLALEHTITGEKATVFELLEEKTGERTAENTTETLSCPENEPSSEQAARTIEKLLAEKTSRQKETLRRFFDGPVQEHTGDFALCGFDPMNMFQLGNYIYGSHFWMLSDLDSGEYITLTGESVLYSEHRGRVSRYWNIHA